MPFLLPKSQVKFLVHRNPSYFQYNLIISLPLLNINLAKTLSF